MNEKIILEILVDRENQKGSGAFEQILIIIHNTLEKVKGGFGGDVYQRPHFSFEIAKIGNIIRFYIVTPSSFSQFIQNQIYAHYPNIEIRETKDYLSIVPNDKILVGEIGLSKNTLYPIKNFVELQGQDIKEMVDPYSSLTASLGKTGNNSLNAFLISFSPIPDNLWKKKYTKLFELEHLNLPLFMKKAIIALQKLRFLLLPFSWTYRFILFFIGTQSSTSADEEGEKKQELMPEPVLQKLSSLGYGVKVTILSASEDPIQNKVHIKEIFSPLGVYGYFGQNAFQLKRISQDELDIASVKQRVHRDDFILSTNELSGLVHLPTSYVKTPNIAWVLSRNFEPPTNLPLFQGNKTKSHEITPIGTTNFRQEKQKFGIEANDRRRHMYIIGKTGMGKSTLLENMILDDIKKGRGVAVIDPHGDLAESIIGNIPKSRTNNTIIFDPSDKDHPIAFNMLDEVSEEHRPLIASGLVGIFKKIFGDSWGPRLEHTLRNTILALLEYPNTTLISIPLMLTSEVYRNKVVAKVTDPVVSGFWKNEFAKMAPNQKVETAGPILNKVGQFLSSSLLRNILGQPKNSFNLRWAMDNQKIVIINLSKGKIGEDASALLGSMMVTKFQIDAMSRADIPEKERKDFYLYVDEFQNFATDSFATILSEARKYRLNLVMANQYIDQMTETVKGAVFGNVGSLAAFQVGYHDAAIMKEVFGEDISTEDLINLRKYSIYTKILIDGMPSKTFSADTFPPHPIEPEVFQSRYEKILQVSREKYGQDRKKVETKINQTIKNLEAQEQKLNELKAQQKKSKSKK